jgi:hypothetical protein
MGEWKYSSRILDLGIRWRWVVGFTPRPLYLRGNNPLYQFVGAWVGPEVDLYAVETKISWPCRESNLGRRARSPSLYRLSYPTKKIVSKCFVYTINILVCVWKKKITLLKDLCKFWYIEITYLTFILIPFLGCYTVLMWAMLLVFRRYVLLPSLGTKCVG